MCSGKHSHLFCVPGGYGGGGGGGGSRGSFGGGDGYNGFGDGKCIVHFGFPPPPALYPAVSLAFTLETKSTLVIMFSTL